MLPTLLDLWGVRRATAATLSSTGSPAEDSADAAFAAASAAAWAATSIASNGTAARPLPPHFASARYMLGGTTVLLEGESLMPWIVPERGAHGSARPQRHKTYARSELKEWTMLHRPLDKQLPGALPRRILGHGWQLYVRTERFAYTAFLRPAFGFAAKDAPYLYRGWRWGHRLIDEALFDHFADPAESVNLAYHSAHSRTRLGLLLTVVRDWNVTLVGPHAADRASRLSWLSGQAKKTVTKERTAAPN